MYRGRAGTNRVQFVDTVIKTRSARLKESADKLSSDPPIGSPCGADV